MTEWRILPKLRLVFQGSEDTCGIACAAMVTGASYVEALRRLSPPPVSVDLAAAYGKRERAFLNEKGWWESAQLLLKNAVGIPELDGYIESEEAFLKTVESSQRLRLILTFADGSKPDHSVVWDRDFKDVVLDPARGILSTSKLFEHVGPQTYSGILGFTSFCYQPGNPIQTRLKWEEGVEIPPSHVF